MNKDYLNFDSSGRFVKAESVQSLRLDHQSCNESVVVANVDAQLYKGFDTYLYSDNKVGYVY